MPDLVDDFLKQNNVGRPKSPKGDDSVARVVHDELSKMGYSPEARLSILGDIGRENNWDRDIIFKGHQDPKNNAYNRGIFSWQGNRQANLNNFLKQQGVYGKNNDDELRGMVRYFDHELQNEPEFAPLYPSIKNAKNTYDASENLRKVIKYVPDAPYNSPDPEFRVKNNAEWAKRAKALGLGSAPSTFNFDNFANELLNGKTKPIVARPTNNFDFDQFSQELIGRPISDRIAPVAQPISESPVTNPDSVQKQIASDQVQFPGSQSDVVNAQDVVAHRIANNESLAGIPDVVDEFPGSGREFAQPVAQSSTTAKPPQTLKKRAVSGQKTPVSGPAVDASSPTERVEVFAGQMYPSDWTPEQIDEAEKKRKSDEFFRQEPRVETKAPLNEGNAGSVTIDWKDWNGENPGKWMARQALLTVAPDYELTADDIEKYLNTRTTFTRTKDPTPEDAASFKSDPENTLGRYNVPLGQINDILNLKHGTTGTRPEVQYQIDRMTAESPEGIEIAGQQGAERVAERDLTERVKQPDYSWQQSLTNLLGDIPKAGVLGYATNTDEENQDIGRNIKNVGLAPPDNKWVDDEMRRLLKQHGNFRTAQEAQKYYDDSTWGEVILRTANQASRSFLKNLISGTGKGAAFLSQITEDINPVNLALPDKAKIGLRNFGNVADFLTRLLTSPSAQSAYDESEWVKSSDPIAKQQIFRAMQEFDKAVGDDPVLKGRFLGALGDAGGSALSFVALGLLAPAASVTTRLGEFGITSAVAGGVQQAGTGYEEGAQSGLSEDKARIYGVIQGLLGASEGFGVGGALGSAIKNPTVRRNLALGILEAGKKGFKEGAKEEFFQEVFQTTGGKIALDYLKDNDPSTYQKVKNALNRLPNQIASTVANEGLIAAMTGGVTSGATHAATASADKTEARAEESLPSISSKDLDAKIAQVLKDKNINQPADLFATGARISTPKGEGVIVEDRGKKLLIDFDDGTRSEVRKNQIQAQETGNPEVIPNTEKPSVEMTNTVAPEPSTPVPDAPKTEADLAAEKLAAEKATASASDRLKTLEWHAKNFPDMMTSAELKELATLRGEASTNTVEAPTAVSKDASPVPEAKTSVAATEQAGIKESAPVSKPRILSAFQRGGKVAATSEKKGDAPLRMKVDADQGFKQWQKEHLVYRGADEVLDGEGDGGGMLGRGLYTVPPSNKAAAKQYGQVRLVVNARPKNPKVFRDLNEWQIWAQNNLYPKDAKGRPDKREFNRTSTIEAAMQKLGFDGIEIKGREIVNFAPGNEMYFATEDQARQYYNSAVHGTDKPLQMAIEEGRKQTKTPEFKKFFEGSKVVDEKGNPRVLAHGTTANFSTFRRAKNDIGIHLGTTGQANDRLEFVNRGEGAKGQNVLPVYVNIQNPLRTDDAGWWDWHNVPYELKKTGQFSDAEIRRLESYADTAGNIEVEYADEDPDDPYAYESSSEYRELQEDFANEVRELLQDKGFDGVVYRNTGETQGAEDYAEAARSSREALTASQKKRGKSLNSYDLEDQQTPEYLANKKAEDAYSRFREDNAEDSYIALEPNQIKSAIGNRGTFDPSSPNILEKRSGDKKLTDLASKTELSDTLPAVTSKITDGELELSREGINLVRHILDLSPSAGLTLTPTHIKTLAKDLKDLVTDLEGDYTTEEIAPVKELQQNLETLNTGDEIALYVPDVKGAKGHEKVHVASYKGIPDKTKREIINFRKLGNLSPTAQKAMQQYADEQGHYLDTPIGKAVVAEEVFTHLVDGSYEDFGLTAEQGDKVILELANAYADARIAENPDLTREEALSTYADTNAAKYLEKAYEETTTGQPVTERTDDEGDSASGTERKGSTEGDSDGERKERKTILTAEKRGVINEGEITDRTYIVKSVEGNKREADEKIERMGIENAVNESILPIQATDENSLRKHGTFQMRTAETLKGLADKAEQDGKPDLAKAYNLKKKAIIETIATQGTDSGQFIRQLGEWNIFDPETAAEYIEKKRSQAKMGKPLTTEEQTKVTDEARQLQELEKKVKALEAKLAEQNKPKQSSAEKKVSDTLSKLKTDALKRIRNIPLQMALPSEGVPDLSLQGQILNDLSDIGASILYTGFESDPVITPEQFKKELLKEVGKKYENNWRQIHAESLTKLRNIQAEIRMQNAVERVRAQKGNELLTDAELIAKVNENLKAAKEKQKNRSEHQKLANEVLTFPEKEAKRVADAELKAEKEKIRAEAKAEREAAKTQARIDRANQRETERLEKAEKRAREKMERDFEKFKVKQNAPIEKQHEQVTKFVETVEQINPNVSDEVLTGALLLETKQAHGGNLRTEIVKHFPELNKGENAKEKRGARETIERISAEASKLYQQVRNQYKNEQRANRGQTLETEAELRKVKSERRKALHQLQNTADTLSRPGPGFIRTVAQVQRMAKVALIQTTVTNLFSTALERKTVNALTNTIDIGLQRVFKSLKDEGLTADSLITNNWWTEGATIPTLDETGQEVLKPLSAEEVVLLAIDEHPEYFQKMYGQLSADIQSGVVKSLDKLMGPLRMQEFLMRGLEGAEALAQRARSRGETLSEALENKSFTKDDMDFMVNKALEATYALRPEKPSIASLKGLGRGEGSLNDLVFGTALSLMHSSGLVDLASANTAPFVGFMYNMVNKYKTKLPILAQARLLVKTGQKAKALKLAGEDEFIRQAIKENWTSRQVANQITGAIMFGLILAVVRSLGDRDEWQYIRIPFTQGAVKKTPENPTGSYYFDVRTQPALAPFFFTANKVNRLINGKDMFTFGNALEEIAEGMLGVSYRQSFETNAPWNAIKHSLAGGWDKVTTGEDPDKHGEKALYNLKKVLGNEAGTMTNFLQFKTMKDMAAQFDKYEQTPLDLDNAPFWQSLDYRLPESKRLLKGLLGAEERKDYATGEAKIGNQLPLLKIFGFNLRDGNTLRPEPSQAEILAGKLAYGGKAYTPPELPDEKKLAAIKKDFEKESDRIRKSGMDKDAQTKALNALEAKLKTHSDLFSKGQMDYAENALETSDLQEKFKKLNAVDAARVWKAANESEKDSLKTLYVTKLKNALDAKKGTMKERDEWQKTITELDGVQEKREKKEKKTKDLKK